MTTEPDSGFLILRTMASARALYEAQATDAAFDLSDDWRRVAIDGMSYRGFGRPLLERPNPYEPAASADSPLLRYLHGAARQLGARQSLERQLDDLGYSDDIAVIPSEAIVAATLSLLEKRQEWDVILVSKTLEPTTKTLGYDVGWWGGTETSGEFYSLIADTFLLPLWHGPPDDAAEREAKSAARLNRHVLFESVADAQAFMDWYAATAWGEQGDFAPFRIDDTDIG